MKRFTLAASAAALLFTLAASGASAQTAAPAGSILAEPWFQEQAKAGLGRLYDMDFGAADAIFGEITARYPDHPVGPYLQSLIPWWAIQLEPDDESQDQVVFAGMDRVLDVCEARLRKHPGDLDALFFRSGAHALRGRLHADRRNWLRAARDGQQALKALQDVRRRDPDNDDLYFGVGAFDYLVDVAPKQYRILRPFVRLFPRGDKERGIVELERAMNKGRFVSTEAAYTLLQIHFLFEKDYHAAMRYAKWLRARHPDNSIFQLYEGRIHERLGRFREAELVFRSVLLRHDQGQSGYTDAMAERALYLLARTAMWQNRPAEALGYIEQLERLTSNRPMLSEYKALGRLRKGMVLDAQGKRQDALQCYREVLTMKGYEGDDDVRARAKGFLKKPYRS